MDEPVAVARDRPLDPRDVGGVEADAKDRHRTPVCLRVPLPDSFLWTQYPWGLALRCRALDGAADHCFTTREPVLGAGPLAAGDGWHRVALAMGIPAASVVRLRQVHGTRVVSLPGRSRVSPRGAGLERRRHRGDRRSRRGARVKVADCVPILLADARRGAVAAVHAGWRGTAAGAARSAVGALCAQFGAAPGDLVAAIGPSIGPCCYRVGEDVRAAFDATGEWGGSLDAWFSPSPAFAPRCGVPGTDPSASGGGPALFLDTWKANADQLQAAGVPSSQIHVSRLCTSCYRETFHSYRVDGDRAGRMIGVIKKKQEARSK